VPARAIPRGTRYQSRFVEADSCARRTCETGAHVGVLVRKTHRRNARENRSGGDGALTRGPRAHAIWLQLASVSVSALRATRAPGFHRRPAARDPSTRSRCGLPFGVGVARHQRTARSRRTPAPCGLPPRPCRRGAPLALARAPRVATRMSGCAGSIDRRAVAPPSISRACAARVTARALAARCVVRATPPRPLRGNFIFSRGEHRARGERCAEHARVNRRSPTVAPSNASVANTARAERCAEYLRQSNREAARWDDREHRIRARRSAIVGSLRWSCDRRPTWMSLDSWKRSRMSL